MGRSSLTKRFFTYTVGMYEKKTGKTILEALDIGNLEITKIIDLVKLGNKGIDEEAAYALLDEYLIEDEDNGIMSAFLDLIEDMDRDLKILKSCGLKVSDLRKQLEEEVSTAVNGTVKNINSAEEEVEADVEIEEEVEVKPVKKQRVVSTKKPAKDKFEVLDSEVDSL